MHVTSCKLLTQYIVIVSLFTNKCFVQPPVGVQCVTIRRSALERRRVLKANLNLLLYFVDCGCYNCGVIHKTNRFLQLVETDFWKSFSLLTAHGSFPFHKICSNGLILGVVNNVVNLRDFNVYMYTKQNWKFPCS